MADAEHDGETTRRRLELVPVGGVPMEWIASLRPELDRRLGTRSAVGAPLPLYPEWLHAGSGRYASGPVVDALLARRAASREEADEAPWMLGIAAEALCDTQGRGVFGEAAVGGGCAVLGAAELGGDEETSARSQTTFLERLLKEAVHEAAHGAGLEHCANPACVMYPSRDIADTDRKGAGFCARCRGAIFAHNP